MSANLDDLGPWPFPTGRIQFAAQRSPAEREAEAINLDAAVTAIEQRERRVIFAETEPEPLIEVLTWHDVAAGDMPDADIVQLLWIRDADGHAEWDRGWWDGEGWRLAESGGRCCGTVLFWAEPEGPAP